MTAAEIHEPQPPAVDHSRDHDLTVQGSQAARARALRLLAEDHDLPTVTAWTIDELDNRLAGLILADRNDSTSQRQRRAVHAWATYLHADVTETRSGKRTKVTTEGHAYGVPVLIWAPLRPASPREAA
jgi:hypothetical protein